MTTASITPSTTLSNPASPTASDSVPHQGDTVRIADDEQLYQVIGVDAPRDRCWLRAWPLGRHGSQVFEISLQQVVATPLHRPGRPA
ncbi:MAG: hypothetical protein VKM97_01700 [Cyanobacteriota bacterium]|nr:hypothetical protein [Cyanobacteriota bacterium]